MQLPFIDHAHPPSAILTLLGKCPLILIFDSTTALSHLEHSPIFQKYNIIAIDMTPAKICEFIVSVVNI